jgi:hypothetical protein
LRLRSIIGLRLLCSLPNCSLSVITTPRSFQNVTELSQIPTDLVGR